MGIIKIDDHVKGILRRMYAFNVPCKEAAEHLNLSYPSVRTYYNILLEIGAYRVHASELITPRVTTTKHQLAA